MAGNPEMKGKRIKALCLSAAAALLLAGCGEQEVGDGQMQAGQQAVEESLSGESQEFTEGDGTSGAVSGTQSEGLLKDIPEGQIPEQSFEIDLDGWGRVTFASFEPEQDTFRKNGIWMYGDARFMLLKDGSVVYTFPAMFEDNGMSGQRFGQVASVSFQDYNEDGRPDVLLLLKYEGVQGIDIGTVWVEARAYTQDEGETDFHLDGMVTEYINKNAVGMSDMDQAFLALAEYREFYSAVSHSSAWEVERFAKGIRKDILAGDFQNLVQKIAFPISVDGIVYMDSGEFLSADFIKKQDEVFLEAIEQAPTENLFCNWQGIMMGNGEVWFAEVLDDRAGRTSPELRIIAVNGISGGQKAEQEEPADDWKLQEEALKERMKYYMASSYYSDISNYWENVREVRDVANRIEFLFETDSRYYTAEDFKEEPSFVIHLAKNEIYARHGYIFGDMDLYHYFMGCIWYMPTTAPEDFDTSVFNEYEKENLKILAELDDYK